MPPLIFYFDFISPYAYLAATQIHALAERHGREVSLAPVLFAGLLDANGTKGPAEIPRKRAHLFGDVIRKAHRLGVPIAPPAWHPFNPLLALRVSSADMKETERRLLVDALFRAVWGESVDVTKPENVAAIAAGVGLDGAALVAWASSDEAKPRVRARTEEALAAGAFGVPTVVADGELFWGLDTFENLEMVLAGRDPIRPETLAAWEKIAPSAARRGG